MCIRDSVCAGLKSQVYAIPCCERDRLIAFIMFLRGRVVTVKQEGQPVFMHSGYGCKMPDGIVFQSTTTPVSYTHLAKAVIH